MAKITPFVCLLAVASLSVTLSGCGEGMARARVRAALSDGGIKPEPAACMADRMVDRLTFSQLRKLEALKGVGTNPFAIAAAIKRIDDPEVVKVTLSAFALCETGLDSARHH